MRNTIKFEIYDWVEIVEALGSKIRQIEYGQFAPEEQRGDDKKWVAHLRRIILKIEGRKCKGMDLAVFKTSVITKHGRQSK